MPSDLHLYAQDIADLEIMSAAVQDALVKAGDLVYDAKARRFTAILARFRWESAGGHGPYERIASGLAFDSVLRVRTRHLRRDEPDAVADILALKFDADEEPPGGVVRLVLAGDGEIALDVECLDATLADVGAAWPTPRRPDHERA